MDDWETVKILKQIAALMTPGMAALIALNLDWLGPAGLRVLQMVQLMIGQLKAGGDNGRADAGRRKRMETLSRELSDLFKRLRQLEAGKGGLLKASVGLIGSTLSSARQMVTG